MPTRAGALACSVLSIASITFTQMCLPLPLASAQQPLGRRAVVPTGHAVSEAMSPEEALVRAAYAKFAYASAQEAISQLAFEAAGTPTPAQFVGMSSDERLSAAEVSFKLSNFKEGRLEEIINRKAVDLITPPVGEMLAATTPVSSYSEGEHRTFYNVHPNWIPAPPASDAVLNATLAELHEMEWHSQAPSTLWQRFVSYSVTVTFQGKTRGPYSAIFIFGHDSKGNAMVMPEDATTASTALATVLAVHLFPGPLVESSLRTYPVVSHWLAARQISAASCSHGQQDVCCDLERLRCGPSEEDVADGLSKPLPFGAVPRRQ